MDDVDLPGSAEWRDWAALPRDVLSIILSLVPQVDILRGAGLVCASWHQLAVNEPLLWRCIDLAADADRNECTPAWWQAMARAAVRRSARRCESFRGRVNGKFLRFLAERAPLLRSLHVTSHFKRPSEKLMTVMAKRLSLLEKLVLSEGPIEQGTLAALVDRFPRLQLLDAGNCHTWYRIDWTLRAKLESRIKELRLPRINISYGS